MSVDVGKLVCRNAQIPLYMYNEALCHLFAFNANEQPAIKRKCQNIQLP